MKASALKYFVISLLASLVSIIIILMPFHAFLTVWGASLFGHYTALRLWKEALLLVCIVGSIYLIMVDHKVRSHTLTRRLIQLIILYGLWLGVRSAFVLFDHSVTHKALGYGLIVDLRFLTFFLVAWAIALRTVRLPAQWQRLMLWPAYGVIVFALLQATVLPDNFLSHFGYNNSTIPAFGTVNNNRFYVRVASTLRGANSLGAYLLLPISLLTVYLVTPLKRNKSHIFIWLAALGALFFSFSRSAYLGVALCIAVVLAVQARRAHVARRYVVMIVAVIVVGLIGLVVLRNNPRIQNVVFHTEDQSAVATSSNQGHLYALNKGLKDVIHEPFGRGPGSAGPASVYNNGKARIAENYFLQLGQEAGLLAVGLFVLINTGVGYLLWVRRADPLALSLFAALIGLTFVNMLSHAWSDDTLAYVWWGLAGIAMAQAAAEHPKDLDDDESTA